MADSDSKMNLKALHKMDPYITSIVATSGQVALYKFQQGKDVWEKTEIEGTLFVYEREAHPKYGFTIMNRRSLDNLVEVVTKDLDFQLQPPFLLYRNTSGQINGIWFFVQKECQLVGNKIEALIKDVDKKPAKKQDGGGAGGLGQLFKSAESEHKGASNVSEKDNGAPPPTFKSDSSGANLLRLLSQQDDLKTQPSPPVEEESTSAVVLDFFAKASSTTQSSSPHPLNSAFTSVPPVSALPPTSIGCQPQGMHHDTRGPMLPLTAMPIKQGLAMGYVPVSLPNPPQTPVIDPVIARLMSNPGKHSVESVEAEQMRSDSALSSSPSKGAVSDLEIQLKASLHMAMGDSNHLFAPLSQTSDHSEAVTLLSPQVFSSRAHAQDVPSVNHNGQIQKHNGQIQNGVVHPPASALTPGQMVEAFTYLLETDVQFVHKLHEAYVHALNRKLQDKH